MGHIIPVVAEFKAFGDAIKANPNAATNDLIVKQLNGASTHSFMAAAPAAMTIVTGVISGHTASALGGSAAGVSGANNFNAVGSAIQDSSVMANLLGTGLSARSSTDAGLGSYNFENGAWLQGFGGWEKRNTRTDVIGSKTVTAGLSIGFDHYISSDVVTGISLQYANINSKVEDNLGKNHANAYSASLFYGAKFGSSIFDASVTVGKTFHKMERTMSVLSTKLTGFAKPQSFDCSAQIGLTGNISEKQFDIKPFVSVGYVHSSMDSYKETGFTNLIYARESDRFSVGTLLHKAGITFTKDYSLNNGTWKPSVTLGYKGSAPVGNDTLKSKLQVLNEWAYQQGFLKSHHMGTLGFKGEWKSTNGLSLTAAYEGAVGNKMHSHDVMLRIAKSF